MKCILGHAYDAVLVVYLYSILSLSCWWWNEHTQNNPMYFIIHESCPPFLPAYDAFLLQSIMNLSFVGKSEYLVSLSRGPKPRLAVWSMSKLSLSWSYKLYVEGLVFFSLCGLLVSK